MKTITSPLKGNDVKFDDQGIRDIDKVIIYQYLKKNSGKQLKFYTTMFFSIISKELVRSEVGAFLNISGNITFKPYNHSFQFPRKCYKITIQLCIIDTLYEHRWHSHRRNSYSSSSPCL